ncbi:hypothetical protein H4R34_000349 [Dimargaris verticillata]|uniref:Pyridoxal phosphate homeostasis protein n=1 Tax=Dimargaris verticillata TaxID=2761393 RepID=A0A9W8B786_9FUNG|nr:hypothetical protein H4R34_000349 [Dimargaris verticillata]
MTFAAATSSEPTGTPTAIQANLAKVQLTVEERRQIPSVGARLVAVSKTKPAADVQQAYDAGQRHFGENYVQELVEKSETLPRDIRWHYIGQLQSNKSKALAAKRASVLNNACSDRPEPLNVFIQVNTSSEENKGGVSPDACHELAIHITTQCPHLHLLGLMTIGSVEHSGQVPNPDFARMQALQRTLSQALGCPLELSMGMSHDYAHALDMGSTNVRVGSHIFGGRPKKS